MNRILTETELLPYLMGDSTSDKANAMLAHQWENFPMAKGFHEALSNVREKSLILNGLTVKIQFNPARIVSSAAKVDEKSISERKCFLCEANLPIEQKGLAYGKDYLMLCNPYLIFPQHLTIPHRQHTDQRIDGRIIDMLALTKELSDFVIFYNGPKCGASAPDHFHFQAGNKGFIPLEIEIERILNESKQINNSDEISLYRAKPFNANALIFLSNNPLQIEKSFHKAYQYLANLSPNEPEPMMNLLSWMIDDQYCLALFPRRLHRPAQYFAEGEGNILLSPASIDLAGVFITPIEKDFDKITAEDLQDILNQLLINDPTMDSLCEALV